MTNFLAILHQLYTATGHPNNAKLNFHINTGIYELVRWKQHFTAHLTQFTHLRRINFENALQNSILDFSPKN
jgi:hypothetical protein